MNIDDAVGRYLKAARDPRVAGAPRSTVRAVANGLLIRWQRSNSSEVGTNVASVTNTSEKPTWVSEYDYSNRRVCLTLADPSGVGHHWSGLRWDESLSDPGGDFDVFLSHRPECADGPTDDPPIIKIVAALNNEGDMRNPHPDFNALSIGSQTIWPYKVAGERFGLAHWVWWVTDEVFRGIPRPWAAAIRDE